MVLDPAPLLALLDGIPIREQAEMLGVSSRTVNRWRAGVTAIHGAFFADRLACRIGVHPLLVWGADWYRPGEPAEDPAA